MKKQVYLDAMGIDRWRTRSGQKRLVVLTDNVHLAVTHPLVANVLNVIGYQVSDCEFVTKAISSDTIVWDMRLINRPHKPGIIYSAPLEKLLIGSDAKRALWQQIYQQEQ